MRDVGADIVLTVHWEWRAHGYFGRTRRRNWLDQSGNPNDVRAEAVGMMVAEREGINQLTAGER